MSVKSDENSPDGSASTSVSAEELSVIDYQKVDRRKLEEMIILMGRDGCQRVFNDIMALTKTVLHWPHAIKIGARNRKNLFVSIIGVKGHIATAKNRVRAIFEGRASRVVLKMAVSHTEQAYILGPDCNNAKSIVSETYTNMQFPSLHSKSSVVSICGCVEQVEHARALVRLKAPLIIIFKSLLCHKREVCESTYVRMLERICNVKIVFMENTALQLYQVMVKGTERDAEKVRTATLLMVNLFGVKPMAGQTHVQIQMEIANEHHGIVKGNNNQNVLSIMHRTQTKIMFPNLAFFPHNSKINIYGRIDNVYQARQLLTGNLPVVVRFDLPIHHRLIGSQQLKELNIKYGVHVVILRSHRQHHCLIHGLEKYLQSIFEARREILHLDTPGVLSEVPENYFLCIQDKYPDYAAREQLTTLLAKYEANKYFMPRSIAGSLRFTPPMPYNWPRNALHLNCACAANSQRLPRNFGHLYQMHNQQIAAYRQQHQQLANWRLADEIQ